MKNLKSKDVWEILRESVFDPREAGPLSVILENSTPEYLTQRAGEELRKKPANLKMAISLLAMARLGLKEPKPKAVKKTKAMKVQDRIEESNGEEQVQRSDPSKHPKATPQV